MTNGCGSNKWRPNNGTLANGTKDQNLRNSGCFVLSHTQTNNNPHERFFPGCLKGSSPGKRNLFWKWCRKPSAGEGRIAQNSNILRSKPPLFGFPMVVSWFNSSWNTNPSPAPSRCNKGRPNSQGFQTVNLLCDVVVWGRIELATMAEVYTPPLTQLRVICSTKGDCLQSNQGHVPSQL